MPKIRWGGLGKFDVIADGREVYSKLETGRIPIAEEIVKTLEPI